jgi:hypothetical protein
MYNNTLIIITLIRLSHMACTSAPSQPCLHPRQPFTDESPARASIRLLRARETYAHAV